VGEPSRVAGAVERMGEGDRRGMQVQEPVGSAAGGEGSVTLDVADLVVEVLTKEGWATVVDGVSFSVRRGETLGIVGESGSGKSVTCLAIAGLMPTRQTRVRATRLRLLDQDLTTLSERELSDVQGKRMTMIFQDPMTSLNPAFTIGDQIAEILRRHERCSRREAKQRAISLLGRMGVPNAAKRYDQYPFEFSGGMRQRAMIAIALACNPDVLIADEPTTALDVTVQAQILSLLRDLQRENGMSIVFITHDLGVVADICDRVMVMYAGQIHEGAPVQELFERPQHPYMEGLLASMPSLADTTELESIEGGPPAIGHMPDGCRFHPRCRYQQERCVSIGSSPPLVEAEPDHVTRCVRYDELALKGRR
jgi:peptide/nickel transport system ATP-binding protein